jgi:hypothetical protein
MLVCRRRTAAAAVCLVVVAGALLLVHQDVLPAPGALLSARMAAKAIRAERSLDEYWHSVDARDKRTEREVRALQRERLKSGVGTRFESEVAERDLRKAADWGKGPSLRPWAARGGGDDEASVKFFRAAAKHPRAARQAIQEEVKNLALQYAHAHRHSDKARVEELADGAAMDLDRQPWQQTGGSSKGKAMVLQADKGLFGSSLTGLVRNVFGGPHSEISKYASEHHAKHGTYHLSALGEPHWDANGNRIMPKPAANDRGLAGVGVKTTNTLKELYKNTGAVAKAAKGSQVSDQDNMHLVRLMDNLLYGMKIERHATRDLRATKEKAVADFSRKLAEHKFDNKMLVGKKNSFFSDDESADAKEPNDGLVTNMLKPVAVTALPDQSPVAKKLKDNEMLISGDKGFFKDEDDANPMGKVLSSSAAQPAAARQEGREATRKFKIHELNKKIEESSQEVRNLEAQREAEAANQGAEDVKDFKVVHAVQKQSELDTEHDKVVEENQRLAHKSDVDAFVSGVNGQEHHSIARGQHVRASAAAPPRQRSSGGLLAKAEHAVIGAEMREKHAERKVKREERQQAREREEVRKMERREEGKGEAMAAKKMAEHEALAADKMAEHEARHAERVEVARSRKDERVEAVRAAGARAWQVMEAREVPAKSGKLTETHVSGDQERQAVAGYFEKLEKQDKYKHKLAVSVIHKEEAPRVAEHAHADGSDLRDMARDDKFFEKLALHDENKAKRSREKRIQRNKDESSLKFYEYVDHEREHQKRAAHHKTSAHVPRAYKEWEHAQRSLEDPKAAANRGHKKAHVASLAFAASAKERVEYYKGTNEDGTIIWGTHDSAAAPAAVTRQPPSPVTAAVKPAKWLGKTSPAQVREGGEQTATKVAALQTKIKAALQSAIQKDVVPEVGQTVKDGIKKALHRRASLTSATSIPALPDTAAAAAAAPPVAAAAPPEQVNLQHHEEDQHAWTGEYIDDDSSAAGNPPKQANSRHHYLDWAEQQPKSQHHYLDDDSVGARNLKAHRLKEASHGEHHYIDDVSDGQARYGEHVGRTVADAHHYLDDDSREVRGRSASRASEVSVHGAMAAEPRSRYEYQKSNLAKVLDTPEPSAKAQLDHLLHDPLSAVESLF